MKLVKIFLTAVIVFSSIAGCQEKKKDQPDSVNQEQNDLSDGVYVEKTYHEKTGTLYTETPYENGTRNGIAKVYYEDGKLASTVEYRNNRMIGQFKAYYEDGSLKSTATYKDGLLDGETIRYFPNGKIEAKQKYVKNKLVYNKKYNKDGKVEFEETLE